MTKNTAKKHPGGAPKFAWTQEVESEIFRRVADGESIRKILATDRDDFLPSWETFRNRLIDDGEFSAKYTRAKEFLADVEFEKTMDIAEKATPETVAVARLQIDVLKWRAGKLRPKVYSDKIDHTSSDGSMTPMPSRIIIEAAKHDDSDDTAAAQVGEGI